jgi:formate hydrogenlyase subunit 3/multisubunit Na+/H+ antiporter MnhD subunit
MPAVAIGVTMLLIAALTAFPNVLMPYLDATAEQLFDPQRYIKAVLYTQGAVSHDSSGH